MTTRTFALSEQCFAYLQQVGWREHPVLAALRVQTQQYSDGKMQTPPEQASLLQFLARLLGVKRYLEMGVFTGYSLLAVALAMPDDGTIVGCDIRADCADITRDYCQQAGVAHKVELILQPARDTLLTLADGAPFDLIYIDADKANYPYYYECALGLLAEGGMIALDNMCLHGRVFAAASAESNSNSVQVMRALNQRIHADPRVEMVLLPIGDGLTLVQKKRS